MVSVYLMPRLETSVHGVTFYLLLAEYLRRGDKQGIYRNEDEPKIHIF